MDSFNSNPIKLKKTEQYVRRHDLTFGKICIWIGGGGTKVDEMRWAGKDQRTKKEKNWKGKKTMDDTSAPAPTIALLVSVGASRAAKVDQQQNTQCGNGVTT